MTFIATSKTDIGDYLKVAACTAVIMQSVLARALDSPLSAHAQWGVGFTYDLVKFTAPAFIFGILYTTSRQAPAHPHYLTYLKRQWGALFVPTIAWTSIYLLATPHLQVGRPFHDLLSFGWQFINGNAAPHLWYNTMMLQFIITMPLFWGLARLIRRRPNLHDWVVGLTISGYAAWLWLYHSLVLTGPHTSQWALLDRVLISFVPYAIFGTLAAVRSHQFDRYLHHRWAALVGTWILCLTWTSVQLWQNGLPVNLSQAPYYQPSMTLYALTTIGCVAALAQRQLRRNFRGLTTIHFLATYAYRAYLANVFWLQLLWPFIQPHLTSHPGLSITLSYLLTWLASFSGAVAFHRIWQLIKTAIKKVQ